MSVAQAAAAFNPSLIGNFGNNGLSSLGRVALSLGDDMERAKYRAATLKLQQDIADGKAQYYRDMAETKRMAIEQKAKDIAVEQAKGEANIAAIKADNPGFVDLFVMNSAKGGEYLDPTKRRELESGLAHLKFSDVKRPNLQKETMADGKLGLFDPKSGTITKTDEKVWTGHDPFALASYGAKLAIEKEEQKPMAIASGKKMAKVSDYMNKGYGAYRLTGDKQKDNIIKANAFSIIDGVAIVPPSQKKDLDAMFQ